ncbi:molecular chaperone SurA [Marinobacter vulgaris]|uniref:Chaperone SurA n=1 Tax=Marinobacter vulgaris TaxID=1928331 RepID=A0A2V3ZPI6_9GAMM|nr:peptidylprolyl isomerase [Marinobacter vulgaris]PXX93434.1 molecular chaperone SurA [Marinobacter vulgaris]TSJ72553.1 molecular chaperone SurA [Marinobacter vulgaris]
MKANLRHCARILLVLMVVALSATVQAERKLLDQVVAVVNDDVILQSELDARINTIVGRLRAQGTGLPPQDVLEERVLEQLITESIQLQMAERAGMRISDNELNETMASIAQRNNMTLDQFEQQLSQEGVTYREAREQIRNEMITSRVQQRQVGNRVRVTDREVENYLEATAGDGRSNAEYELAHILVQVEDFNDDEEVREARNKIERLREEIAGGRDFREVAVAESDASNALEGGDMGWRAENRLPSLIADVVPDLETGTVSPVLQNSSGFHLVMVMDRRGGEEAQVIEQSKVRHILVRTSETVSESQAEEAIRELYEQLQNGADFDALAREYSDDPVSGSDGGNLGWVSPGQMVPEFEQAMMEADVGELKGPFRSQFGWHILQVQDRRQQDISGDVRESEARQAIYRRKFDTELQNWLREIRDEAFIEFKNDDSGDASES